MYFVTMSTTRKNANQTTFSELEVRELITKDLKEWGFKLNKNEDHKILVLSQRISR